MARNRGDQDHRRADSQARARANLSSRNGSSRGYSQEACARISFKRRP